MAIASAMLAARLQGGHTRVKIVCAIVLGILPVTTGRAHVRSPTTPGPPAPPLRHRAGVAFSVLCGLVTYCEAFTEVVQAVQTRVRRGMVAVGIAPASHDLQRETTSDVGQSMVETERCPSPRGGVSGGSGVAAVPESGMDLEDHSRGEEAGEMSCASSVCSHARTTQEVTVSSGMDASIGLRERHVNPIV